MSSQYLYIIIITDLWTILMNLFKDTYYASQGKKQYNQKMYLWFWYWRL